MENDFPHVARVVVEVPKGCRNKYEFDHEKRRIKLDRVISSAMHYPFDYGFVENTRAEDGDEVDVLVLIEEPTFSGCLIEAKPVGLLQIRDEKGIDNRIIAVPLHDPRWSAISNIDDISAHLQVEIEDFFLTYKRLETKTAECDGWRPAEEAMTYLVESRTE